MAERIAKIKKWLWLWVYALALAAWLLLALFRFLGDGGRAEAVLLPESAALEEMAEEGAGLYRTEGADSKMIFMDVDAEVRLVKVFATFEKIPGEMELFYTKSDEAGFSAAKRVIGVPQADGSYLYSLPAGNMHALRVDFGTTKDNGVQVQPVVLNPKLPAAHYFVPTPRDGMALLVWPALALCVLYTLEPLWQHFAKRRETAEKTA